MQLGRAGLERRHRLVGEFVIRVPRPVAAEAPDAGEEFLGDLSGVTDPEQKR
jgi:GMP synthase PP-ATPase subunit